MANYIQSEFTYFFHEGKENMEECVRASFEAAVRRNVNTLVIFTAKGEGPKLALQKFLVQPCYEHIKVIAVTFPYGQFFTNAKGERFQMEISHEDREIFKQGDIPIVRAHLPFDPIAAHHKNHGILGQDLTLIGNALSIFCGSMSLCVQAALMACDAGEVPLGEHVISLTSDTAILARISPTERLLTDFIVREIVCKPMGLTIARRERLAAPVEQVSIEIPPGSIQLLPPEPE